MGGYLTLYILRNDSRVVYAISDLLARIYFVKTQTGKMRNPMIPFLQELFMT